MDDAVADFGGRAPVAGLLLAAILAFGVAGLSLAPRIIGAGMLRPWRVARVATSTRC